MKQRPATPEDAEALARLIDMAGHGLPRWVWALSLAPDGDVFAAGVERARRATGGFSYRNAEVLADEGGVAGMALGYRLDDPYDADGVEDLPPPIRPLVELEAEAPGAWYLNAVAVMPERRGQGLGSRLLARAEERARDSGADAIALIVEQVNDGAVRLYERTGYVVVARRPIARWAEDAPDGDWLLMRKLL